MAPIATTSNSLLWIRARARGSVLHLHVGSASRYLQLHARAVPRVLVRRIETPSRGFLSLHGLAYGRLNKPYGAFRDFAHYQNTSLDPAMVLVRSHNGGAVTYDGAQTSGYRRYFAIASSPLDYPVSGGKKAWSRAAYASLGLKFKGLVANGFEYIDGAQFEIAKYAAVAPVAFQSARSLNCVVVPNSINLATNPAAVGASGTTSTKDGILPKVVGFTNGDDSTGWQSTLRPFVGLTSVAIEWFVPVYPSTTTYPSTTLYPS